MLALQGKRVGIVDTDLQSPGIHVLFGIPGDSVQFTLNNYLWGTAEMTQVIQEVTPKNVPGRIFLVPSSIKMGDIARVLRDPYDDRLLRDGLKDFISIANLDVLLIDTHPGLNEETLLCLAISNALGLVMRPDRQDYEGTGVTIGVARRLDVQQLSIIVNKMPPQFDPAQVKAQVEQTYQSTVAAVLPHSDELLTLSSEGLFAVRFPDHPLTTQFGQVATTLMGN